MKIVVLDLFGDKTRETLWNNAKLNFPAIKISTGFSLETLTDKIEIFLTTENQIWEFDCSFIHESDFKKTKQGYLNLFMNKLKQQSKKYILYSGSYTYYKLEQNCIENCSVDFVNANLFTFLSSCKEGNAELNKLVNFDPVLEDLLMNFHQASLDQERKAAKVELQNHVKKILIIKP
jgi:hypothetical protein